MRQVLTGKVTSVNMDVIKDPPSFYSTIIFTSPVQKYQGHVEYVTMSIEGQFDLGQHITVIITDEEDVVKKP